MTGPQAPPGERGRARPEPDPDNLANESTIDQAGDIPANRPWARRPDAPEVEARFQADRRGWQRRISCARRTSYDGQDEVAPAGRWSS